MSAHIPVSSSNDNAHSGYSPPLPPSAAGRTPTPLVGLVDQHDLSWVTNKRSCTQQFVLTADRFDGLIHRCSRMPAAIQGPIIHKMNRLIDTQEMISTLLDAQPFTGTELAKTRLLLEDQLASVSALDRLMALPTDLLLPPFRRYMDLHQAGLDALEQLQEPDLHRNGHATLEEVLGRLDAADNLADYHRLLEDLAEAVRKLKSHVWPSRMPPAGDTATINAARDYIALLQRHGALPGARAAPVRSVASSVPPSLHHRDYMRIFRQAQVELASLQRDADQRPPALRAWLARRFARVGVLEERILRCLSSASTASAASAASPGMRPSDLPVLLSLHGKFLASLRCLLRDVPDSRHEQLLGRWWRLLTAGEALMAQLGRRPGAGDEAMAFTRAVGGFDVATNLPDCEHALRVLEVTLRQMRRSTRMLGSTQPPAAQGP